jgi:dienelactone hydrolase
MSRTIGAGLCAWLSDWNRSGEARSSYLPPEGEGGREADGWGMSHRQRSFATRHPPSAPSGHLPPPGEGTSKWRIGVLSLLVAGLLATPSFAQQAVKIPVTEGPQRGTITGTFYRPNAPGPAPAAALLHGCGGVGQNHLRMAAALRDRGYATVMVDSFSARGIKDACGAQGWPTLAQGAARAFDVDAAVRWLAAQPGVDAQRIAVLGWSYGGGVVLMRAMQREAAGGQRASGPAVRAWVGVYPDCDLLAEHGASLAVRQPTLLAMAELDDWTPVSSCRALLGRIGLGRENVQAKVYVGAHHSFDALGSPVKYMAGAGNRSKPNNCCGAHWGENPAANRQFVDDVTAFLAKAMQ